VQEVLAASQEGGHHPRFTAEALLALPVPARVVAGRDALSRAVSAAIASLRAGRAAMARAVFDAGS
jgi:hypothetical protein